MRMAKIAVSFLLAFGVVIVSSQQCREIMRPVTVCDDVTSSLGKGQKGERGLVGKAGSKGEKGDPGDPCEEERMSFTSLASMIRQNHLDIKKLLTPASCYTSSVYGLQELRSGEKAFCDDGWTVFQRRLDGSVNFIVNWDEYKSGFGNLSGEFWLGLNKIHSLTYGRLCKLRIELWDFTDIQAYAQYSLFFIEDESTNYRLHVSGYSGTAGDSLSAGSHVHDLQEFSSPDRDNDKHNDRHCSTYYNEGLGGWWFNACFSSALNAAWGRSGGNVQNIIWQSWKGYHEALKATTMKLRCY
ncbi:fibroleukin-like [Clavelina lepadiformis]|uniref:fibroleukin-like n=1 Tax=Clavelina lepadiformis TaxID=159417 RepID=UPI004041D274